MNRTRSLQAATGLWLLSCLAAAAALAQAKPAVPTPLVRVNGQVLTGVFLNNLGHVAAPLQGDGAEWVVDWDSQQYPARVVQVQARYGVTLLKVDRDGAFPFAPLAQKPPGFTTRLSLRGVDAAGVPVQRDTTVRRVRRRIAEANLDGSFLELAVAGEPPREGAVLLDPATGEVHGMLLPPIADVPERYAVMASTMSERAALTNVPLGAAELPRGPQIVYPGGRAVPATVRQLRFTLAAGGQELPRARAIQDWRVNTGFWINALTSPLVTQGQGLLGALNGNLYGLDIPQMQRSWVFPNELPVFFPPSANGDRVVCTSGSIGITSWQEADPFLYAFLGAAANRTRRLMVDAGFLNCVEQKTGVYKWSYRTRFLSQAHITGDRVIFGGMGILGALNLSDGKEQWTLPTDRKDTTPEYYSLAGVARDRVWVLGIKVHMEGEGTKEKPYRLVQVGDGMSAVCFNLAGGQKPLWSTRLKATRGAPALSGAMLLSPDGKTCYGASGNDVFAVDAETGARKWQVTTFSAFFGGSLALGDGILFATDAQNKLHALDPADGKSLWTFETARAPLCLPLAQDGVVYVGSLDTWIYALDGRTGRLVWKLETGGKVCGQPRILGNKLYCTSDDGRLTEIELPR